MADAKTIMAAAEKSTKDFNKDFSLPRRESGALVGLPPIDKQPTEADPIRTRGYYLIPSEPLGEVARVFQIGAEKYEPRGWEKGFAWSEAADRIFKHFGYWSRGEKFDKDDGQHNLASVAWGALILMEFERTHPELDDIHG